MNILVHGIHTADPAKTIGKLTYHLRKVILFDYGWFGLLSVLFYNKREARRLKEILNANRDSTVFAHSNGCAIAVESARYGAFIETLVCINPALKCDTLFPASIERIIVIHTRYDKPTRAARFFDKVPFIQLLIPNAWGSMGADGYNGKDPRVKNWNLSVYLDGHSDFFEESNLKILMPELKKWIGDT
jgi:pimeloyl-ACP methyl ester carboxylesterase